ncbi:MAG: flavin reductase family protein [Candidatus Diapherotrites archaeon]
MERQFNEEMKKILQGVYIITSSFGAKKNAMAAAWVSRLSFNPPMLMVSVGDGRHSQDIISKGKCFAVHAAGEKQLQMAKEFGSLSGRDSDKLAGKKFSAGKSGAPILDECIAWFDCRLVKEVRAGDHIVFIGEVIDAKTVSPEEKTLAYDRERFK